MKFNFLLAVYSVLTGLAFALFGRLLFGLEYIVVMYLLGASYGMLGYELWLILVETYHYDEGHKPTRFDGKQACITTMLPVGACLTIMMLVLGSVIMLSIAVVWITFQVLSRRTKLSDLCC